MLGRRVLSLLITCTTLCGLGCSGKPSPLAPPEIPNDAGAQAVSKYDANGDGMIGGDELAKVPALKTNLKRVDANGDGQVSAEEIDQQIQAWRNSKIALASRSATVRMDGRPLVGAVVKYVPESFLGSAVKAAEGTTRNDGTTHILISPSNPDEAGVHLGYYRVEISKKGSDGKELVPARYNSETELGIEVARDDPPVGNLIADLKSK